MPLAHVRYRVTTKNGHEIRLAFRGGKRKGQGTVVEAKNLESGATHTPAEFAKDRSELRKVRKDANLTSHPMTPRELLDNEIHSQLVGQLRGVGENYT